MPHHQGADVDKVYEVTIRFRDAHGNEGVAYGEYTTVEDAPQKAAKGFGNHVYQRVLGRYREIDGNT